jgi:hypothetical protein
LKLLFQPGFADPNVYHPYRLTTLDRVSYEYTVENLSEISPANLPAAREQYVDPNIYNSVMQKYEICQEPNWLIFLSRASEFMLKDPFGVHNLKERNRKRVLVHGEILYGQNFEYNNLYDG